MSEKPQPTGPDGAPSSPVSQAVRKQPDRQPIRPVPYDPGWVTSTYRYIRLAIVTVIAALIVSLILERSHASCWNDSISSYYYTPVHSIFVTALGVIGVALFAIRGATLAEEVLLNMAGFLAPVVALVPTGWSSSDCPSNLTDTSKATVNTLLSGNRFFAKFSANNLLALIVAGLIAVVLASAITFVQRRRAASEANYRAAGTKLPKEVVVPAMGSAVVVVIGLIWHKFWLASFDTHAHSYSAILMFILVAIVMLSTAERDESRVYRIVYFVCPSAMAAGFLVVFIVGALQTWHHEVLVLEIIELTMFVIFWCAQTIQLWDADPAAPEQPGNGRPLGTLSARLVGRVPPIQLSESR
jgi:hypothetical protein